MKGLVLYEDNSMTLLHNFPFPFPTPGSVTVRLLANLANPNFVHLLRGSPGSHPFTQPRLLTPCSNCVGHVAFLGTDAVSLNVGQLILIEGYIKARDDPSVKILWGMHGGDTVASKRLYRDSWRDGSYAEYMRAPLENTYALDEEVLCSPAAEGGLGYSIPDLLHLIPHTVPCGGLRSINLQPGETLVISPAT